jgi:hypothetical protein
VQVLIGYFMVDSATRNVTQLRFEDKDGLVVVTPEDEDRFSITVEAAIRACQVDQKDAIFRFQFKRMLNQLAAWLTARSEHVAKAFVSVREVGLLFLVVRKARNNDAFFEDDLTDLDLQIAQDPDLDLIRLSVLAIPCSPDEAVESFLMPGNLLQYHYA